jgi:hypothetical protein
LIASLLEGTPRPRAIDTAEKVDARFFKEVRPRDVLPLTRKLARFPEEEAAPASA